MKYGTGNLKLREASIDDLDLLEYWDKQPHVIAAAPNDEWDWETELQQNYDWQEMLVAEFGGRPIGFLQIIDPAREETHYWGKIEENCRAIDIWIGKNDDLGKGYGTEIMKHAIEHCFKDPKVHTIWIDPLESNAKAHKFYVRFGFKFVEKRRFGMDNCFVYKLDRKGHYGNPATSN